MIRGALKVLIATLIAALAAILLGTTAPALAVAGAEIGVGAINPVATALAGAPAHITAGQRLGTDAATPGTVVATGVAANGEVALDTNPVISALSEGRAADVDKALAGRSPVLSPQAFSEATVRHSPEDVMRFLAERGGRIGPEATPEGISSLQAQATSMGRVLRTGDAAVLHSAMQEGLPLITNDVRFGRFLNAIGYPFEGY